MSAIFSKSDCVNFAETAQPYLHIQDVYHYEAVLELIEELLEDAEDSTDDPLNAIIEMLSNAIEIYENSNRELTRFEALAMQQPSEISVLRLLMDQYELGVNDLPEIGSKSMVSRVLSGERDLNKKHIKALSERFNVNPGLFF